MFARLSVARQAPRGGVLARSLPDKERDFFLTCQTIFTFSRMLWTTPTFSQKLRTRSIAWVWLSVSFLVISQAVAASDITNDVSHISGTLDILNEFIQQDTYNRLGLIDSHISGLSSYIEDLPTYENRVLAALTGRQLTDSFSWSDTDNIRNWSHLVARAMYGTDSPTGAQKNKSIITLLEQVLAKIPTNTASSSPVGAATNIWVGQDILAGNPWWATNSAFALTLDQYSRVYPNEYPNNDGTFSFPQFLSRWSGMLSRPGASGNPETPESLRSNWWRFFGSLNRSVSAINTYPYTWFDWVVDAMRSNIVLQSSVADNASDDAYNIQHLLSLLLEYAESDSSSTVSNILVSSQILSSSVSNTIVTSQILEDLTTTSNDIAQVSIDPQYTEPLEEGVTTNSVPELEIEKPSDIDIDPFSDAAEIMAGVLPSSGSGTPAIVVVPEMTIGGIHIARGQGNLAYASSPSQPGYAFYFFLSRFATWFWRLLGFVGVFLIVRTEYNYWSTLGGSASE